MSKLVASMLLALLVLSGLVMVGSVFSQSVTAPSTPTFTLKFLGQYMNDTRIQVTIDNQPLPANLDNGKYSIYYNIQFKPHSSKYFNQVAILNKIDNSLSPDPTEASITEQLEKAIPTQPNSPITTYTIVTKDFNPDVIYNAGDQIDVQVKAMIGHNFTRWYPGFIVTIPGGYQDLGPVSYTSVTQDSESNWSETQTVTIPEIQTPSPEPAISQEPVLILSIVAFVAVFAFGLVLLYRIKSKKGS